MYVYASPIRSKRCSLFIECRELLHSVWYWVIGALQYHVKTTEKSCFCWWLENVHFYVVNDLVEKIFTRKKTVFD